MSIPQTIHYCWFGRGPMSDLATRCVEGWTRALPGYRIRRWDETNAPINEPCVAEALRFRKFAFASDFVRAWALQREGGIYLDVDVEVVRSFDHLLKEEAFLGFQEEPPGGHWINGAVVGSVPQHWFMQAWIDLYRHTHRTRFKPRIVPEICTSILMEAGLSAYGLQTIRGVLVCPTPWFYPYHMHEVYTPACIKPETVAIHHWANDWGSGSRQSGFAKLPYRLARLRAIATGCWPWSR